ncbi:response regulator transcription factor [Patulibacter minatonensis]|uniref:response regulator transcription factor n=1 Tax=Patulibacter minatonensis TaxID=298163 RepID=UPI00047B4332|nr:response regulator transcription factor [Patulibacter minatonensis]
METSILVVEDDDVLREVMADGLRAAGHDVRAVADAAGAFGALAEGGLDLLLLDVGLGAGPDGVEVCRRLRRDDHDLYVMMLTARDAEAEVVLALEAGADDYVTKPVGLAELRSRVAAALRRVSRAEDRSGDDVLRHDALMLRPGPRTAAAAGTDLRLTPSEFAVLETLLRAGGSVRSRTDLLRAIFGDDDHRDPRAVDVHVHHLREKIEAAGGDPAAIATVRGAGYRLGA